MFESCLCAVKRLLRCAIFGSLTLLAPAASFGAEELASQAAVAALMRSEVGQLTVNTCFKSSTEAAIARQDINDAFHDLRDGSAERFLLPVSNKKSRLALETFEIQWAQLPNDPSAQDLATLGAAADKVLDDIYMSAKFALQDQDGVKYARTVAVQATRLSKIMVEICEGTGDALQNNETARRALSKADQVMQQLVKGDLAEGIVVPPEALASMQSELAGQVWTQYHLLLEHVLSSDQETRLAHRERLIAAHAGLMETLVGLLDTAVVY